MRHPPRIFFAQVLCIVFFLAQPASLSLAQSGAELQAWRRWCRSIGGTHNNDANNPVCTPGSSSSSSRATRDTLVDFPLPPDPLPALSSEYQSVRGWFRSDVFPDAPSAIRPTNLAELYFALDRLAEFTGRRLSSLRSQKAALETRYRELQLRLVQNRDSSDLLRSEIDRLEIDIAATNREIQTAGQDLEAQNSQNDQIVNVLAQIEREKRETRADLFRALYDASRRQLIHAPSTYQSLPRPIAPQYRVVNKTAETGSFPLAPAGLAPPFASSNLQTAGATASSAKTVSSAPITEGTVRQKLDAVRSLIPEVNSMTNDLNEVYRRVQTSEQTLSSSSSAVTTMRGEVERLRSTASTATRNLTVARARLSDAVATYQQNRDRFPLQCLELGLSKYYNKQVKDLLKKLPGVKVALPAVSTNALGKLVNVMKHVVDLNNETLKVIDWAPAALAFGAAGDVEALIRELDDVVNRFKVNIFNDLTGEELLKYKREAE